MKVHKNMNGEEIINYKIAPNPNSVTVIWSNRGETIRYLQMQNYHVKDGNYRISPYQWLTQVREQNGFTGRRDAEERIVVVRRPPRLTTRSGIELFDSLFPDAYLVTNEITAKRILEAHKRTIVDSILEAAEEVGKENLAKLLEQ